MRARSTPRLAALVVLVIGSTVGSRVPAAAAPSAVPYELVPSIVVERPEPARAEYRAVDDFALADAAQTAALHAVWLVADNEARLARERAAAELDALWGWWILDVDAAIQRRTGRYLPWPTVALVIEASVRHGVDPVLVGRIGACESGGRADAWNPSGASGFGQHLAQYWPARAAGAGLPGASPFDLAANIEVTAWYLARAGTSPWNPSRYCWG